ncbi:MAG: hypothetical protein U0168_03350 [Nannocystaceae bacterium]
MKRPTHALMTAYLVSIAGSAVGMTGCQGETDNGSSANKPFRDKWRVEHEGEFKPLDDEGMVAIQNILIGNMLGSADNFINRGDVIVKFDGEPDTIKIEFRRFTYSTDEEAANEVFDKLQLWAYNANTGSPKKPDDMEEDARCGGENADGEPYPWQDGCAIFVYYDGMAQLKRAGVDIRVTLPPDYHQDISIETADNVEEFSYPNRGNVCIEGLAATVDVQMQSGEAYVIANPTEVAGQLNPYPKCPEDLVQMCVEFQDLMTMEPAAWDKDCPCINQGYEPGTVKVTALKPASANITVDVPSSLWTSFRAENTGKNELSGDHCDATIDGFAESAIVYKDNDSNKPWLRSGSINVPPAALAGGFFVSLTSEGCEPVAAVESPKDWDPNGGDPDTELRGKTEVCSGCLAGKSCEDLLPGG